MFTKLCPKCGFQISLTRVSKTRKYELAGQTKKGVCYCPQCSEPLRLQAKVWLLLIANIPLLVTPIWAYLTEQEMVVLMRLLIGSSLLALMGNLYFYFSSRFIKAG